MSGGTGRFAFPVKSLADAARVTCGAKSSGEAMPLLPPLPARTCGRQFFELGIGNDLGLVRFPIYLFFLLLLKGTVGR
jgi:hypothetical protein